MSYGGVQFRIMKTALSTVGVAVNPHLFRTCAASTAATRAVSNRISPRHSFTTLIPPSRISIITAHQA